MLGKIPETEASPNQLSSLSGWVFLGSGGLSNVSSVSSMFLVTVDRKAAPRGAKPTAHGSRAVCGSNYEGPEGPGVLSLRADIVSTICMQALLGLVRVVVITPNRIKGPAKVRLLKLPSVFGLRL